MNIVGTGFCEVCGVATAGIQSDASRFCFYAFCPEHAEAVWSPGDGSKMHVCKDCEARSRRNEPCKFCGGEMEVVA